MMNGSKLTLLLLLGFLYGNGFVWSFAPPQLPMSTTVFSSRRAPPSTCKSAGSGPGAARLHAGVVEFIEPSYNLAIGSFGIGLLGGVLEDVRNAQGVKLATAKIFGSLALIFTLFSAFLVIQTTTLRFTFDETYFSLVDSDGSSIGDNIKVGGENKWSYSSFQNWAFLPSEDLPILVYFRETQTPVENRAEAPIVVDNLDGQAHFFPSISNAQQLKQGFVTHGCKKL
jgi:Protein of unknown function (DUF3119)